MKEKDKRPYVIAIVSVLVILVIVLVGYLVFSLNSKDKEEVVDNESITSTTTTSSELSKEENKIEVEEKIINIEVKNNEEIDTSSYWYEREENQELSYVVKDGENEIEIKYYDGYSDFKINGELVSKYTPDLYILYSVKKFNNYLFVELACPCGIPPVWYTINMEKKEVSESLCRPSNDGICEGVTYKETFDDNYYEYSYTMNYATSQYEEEKIGEFSCSDYKIYDIKGTQLDDNGNPLDPNLKKCEDDVCQRRTDMCFPFAA